VHFEEFFEYGGKAVCSNHVFNFKIGKSTPTFSSSAIAAGPPVLDWVSLGAYRNSNWTECEI